MIDANVYYCWACDAHRKAMPTPEGKTLCPRCQRELAADARLPMRAASSSAEGTIRIAWPAPIRPRLAASA